MALSLSANVGLGNVDFFAIVRSAHNDRSTQQIDANNKEVVAVEGGNIQALANAQASFFANSFCVVGNGGEVLGFGVQDLGNHQLSPVLFSFDVFKVSAFWQQK